MTFPKFEILLKTSQIGKKPRNNFFLEKQESVLGLSLKTDLFLSGTCFDFHVKKNLIEIVNVPYGVLMPNVSFGELFTVLPISCVLLTRANCT